jgi:hypothetical protein
LEEVVVKEGECLRLAYNQNKKPKLYTDLITERKRKRERYKIQRQKSTYDMQSKPPGKVAFLAVPGTTYSAMQSVKISNSSHGNAHL